MARATRALVTGLAAWLSYSFGLWCVMRGSCWPAQHAGGAQIFCVGAGKFGFRVGAVSAWSAAGASPAGPLQPSPPPLHLGACSACCSRRRLAEWNDPFIWCVVRVAWLLVACAARNGCGFHADTVVNVERDGYFARRALQPSPPSALKYVSASAPPPRLHSVCLLIRPPGPILG